MHSSEQVIIGLVPVSDTDWGYNKDQKAAQWESTYNCDPYKTCFAYWENDELKYSNDKDQAKKFSTSQEAHNYLYENGSSFLAKAKYHKVYKA